MFQPQPPAAQRRHRRLPSGTMVSYAEVKSYLSKREIPQLFESLMAGLMYHRPENHIGYLQSCLDEVKSNNETKIHWSTFVNKKRKSKEILPPLTPKKQDSFSSSWSDNSRQSTPLPPISARTTRTRQTPEQQQQDLRNTYILYHNPPPILAKPKVPVVSVLGGLGSKIDELCEKAVSRLRGVVHISTCSMLKTRMTIEGFYRVTSVPACAVVDSVLQAMSMVQSANALIVAGFPRNRGDIEEYRSRRVRMDGVILVDFEEEALRSFLRSEVSIGAVRSTEIETELERYKQDIISVAEYYDEKELLTVVMGDQDMEEMVEDIIIAVDKVIETRKDLLDEGDSLPNIKSHECDLDGPCKALLPSPETVERPSTVEIRDATEEDIKEIEVETRKSAKENDTDDVKTLVENVSNSMSEEKQETNMEVVETNDEDTSNRENNSQKPNIPLIFAFENIIADSDSLKDLVVSEKGMCYIEFTELIRSDGDNEAELNPTESLNLLQSVLQRDTVSYSNGFFISGFPFALLKETNFENVLKLGDVTFVCKIREKSPELESEVECNQESLLFDSPLSESVKIIFVTESNFVEELKSYLQEITDKEILQADDSKKSSTETKPVTSGDLMENKDSERKNSIVISNESEEKENFKEDDQEPIVEEKSSTSNADLEASDLESKEKVTNDCENEHGNDDINEESEKEMTSKDDNEDSTCKDVEDIVSDDAQQDVPKPSDILSNEEDVDAVMNTEAGETISETSMESASEQTLREKAVLARQDHLDLETESVSQLSDNPNREELEHDSKDNENDLDLPTTNKLIRQATFSSSNEHQISSNKGEVEEPSEEAAAKSESSDKDDNKSVGQENEDKSEEVTDKNSPETPGVSDEDELNNSVKEEKSEAKEEDDQSKPIEHSQTEGEETEEIDGQTSETQLNECETSPPAVENETNIEKEISNGSENESSLKISNPETKETTDQISNTSNKNSVAEVEEEKLTTENVDEVDENKETEIPHEAMKDEVTNNSDNVEEEKENDSIDNDDTSLKKETEAEQTASELEENNMEISNKSDNDEKDVTDIKENAESSEKLMDGNGEDENSIADKNDSSLPEEQVPVEESEDESKVSALTNENQSEAKDSSDAENENKDKNVISDANSQDENDKETDEQVSNSPETQINDDENKDNDPTSENDDDKSGNHSVIDNNLSEKHTESEIPKNIDNDSDSNDERSITIETKAEVHAADSESPPLVDDSTPDHKSEDEQNEDSVKEASTASDLAKEDGAEKESPSEKEDSKHDSEEKSSNNNDSVKEQTETERECEGDKEDSKKITESLTHQSSDEAQLDGQDDHKDDEIVTEAVDGGDSGETVIDEINNERYSSKCMERNGSGILGESRQEDRPENEEHQERSSSSSRGEL